MGRPLSPVLARYLGHRWLQEFMAGKTISKISQESHRTERTVKKYMSKAAAALVEQAQTEVMLELIPAAKKVLLKALEQQIKQADAGKDIDITFAERLMGLMNVVGQPMKPEPEDIASETQVSELTLAGYVNERLPKRIGERKEVPALPAGPIIDVNESETVPQPEDGRESGSVSLEKELIRRVRGSSQFQREDLHGEGSDGEAGDGEPVASAE